MRKRRWQFPSPCTNDDKEHAIEWTHNTVSRWEINPNDYQLGTIKLGKRFNSSRQHGHSASYLSIATEVIVSRDDSSEETAMSRFIALILIPFSMLMQPMPHVHWADGADTQENHTHHGHVHLSSLWGEHSHHHHDHHTQHQSAPTPGDSSHDADALYFGDLAATLSSSCTLKLVTTSWQPTTHAHRQHDAAMLTGKGLPRPAPVRLCHLGSITDLPLFLQGGSFRT